MRIRSVTRRAFKEGTIDRTCLHIKSYREDPFIEPGPSSADITSLTGARAAARHDRRQKSSRRGMENCRPDVQRRGTEERNAKSRRTKKKKKKGDKADERRVLPERVFARKPVLLICILTLRYCTSTVLQNGRTRKEKRQEIIKNIY